MPEKRLPKSIRKYIRQEKARIRREIFDLKEQQKLINELYQKFFKNQRKSAEAAPSEQNIKTKQPAAPSPKGRGSAKISVKVRNIIKKEI